MVACALPDKGALVRGIHGTCEPAVTQIMQVRDIDVVLVPGIAFDREGNRLGRGKGCYDRFLCTLQPHTRTVGLAFDFQIVSSLPVSACDVRVDRVLSA
jgi:5-formyltetrahydrofolate cyclo-ligase